ncbi:MAG: hypothetical protein KDA65_08175 [Planctomycetaceae bacterium]|nr:hypothetical protein [Planctomycetaceae bacterium]
MDEQVEKSVTLWIKDVKQGDQEALRNLWERYFNKLVKTAGWKMRDMPKREADEEDIALSAFDSLYRGAEAGRFEQLKNRDDLWRLLIAITSNKIVDQVRKRNTQKRGGGEVRGESILTSVRKGDDGSPAGFEMFMDEDPSPEFLVTLEEEHQLMLGKLRDDTQRSIATLRLQGYTNEEIAEELGISLRSVERKLNLIRDIWSSEINV